MNVAGGQIRVDITHACGHKRRQAAYPGASLEEWKQKLEATDCSDCWLKKQPPEIYLRTRQDGGLAIDVSRGYPIKDVLYSRGYMFRRPSWCKRFRTEAERREEVAWFESQGYEVRE